MLQFNMGPGQPMYAPARDIAYLYPHVTAQVEQRLYEGPFQPLSRWLRERGISDSVLADAVKVYCQFLNAAHQKPEQSVEECLEEVGWFSVPAEARIAIMFYVGAAMTGSFFQGIRDVTKEGENPRHMAALLAVGNRAARYANAGRLRRAFLRFLSRWLLWPRNSKPPEL